MLKKDAEDLITTHELIQLLLLKKRHHQHCKVKPSESSQPLGKEEGGREEGRKGGREGGRDGRKNEGERDRCQLHDIPFLPPWFFPTWSNPRCLTQTLQSTTASTIAGHSCMAA